MSYLYLNFIENLNERNIDPKWGRREIYLSSLNDQFAAIQQKFRISRSLEDFMKIVFPRGRSGNHHLSLSGMEREATVSEKGAMRIRNIVLRPEPAPGLGQFIPSRYELIFVGDLRIWGEKSEITVKGLEIIDANTQRSNEMEISSEVSCSFKLWQPNNSPRAYPYYESGNDDSALTNDFINELTKMPPIPKADYSAAREKLEKWKEYIEFRKYYLQKQIEKTVPIDSLEIKDSYLITREVFRSDASSFEKRILDGEDDFKKGEQIIIDGNSPKGEPFPLIKVEVRRNRKSLYSDLLGEGDRARPKFEAFLKRFIKQPLCLAREDSANPDRYGNTIRNLASLGDRYKFISEDVPPDLSGIEAKYASLVESANREVDQRYLSIIAAEVNRAAKDALIELREKAETEHDEYVISLKARFEKDVEANEDPKIRAEFQKWKKNKEKEAGKEKRDEAAIRAEELRFLRNRYQERNHRLEDEKFESLERNIDETIRVLRGNKEKERRFHYQPQIEDEKAVKEKELLAQKKDEIEKAIENETVRVYRIYFRPDDQNSTFKILNEKIGKLRNVSLAFDSRAEKAKLDRERRALDALYDGYVRNPYLLSYLFAPETLKATSFDSESDLEWNLESLNDSQKEAVKKALTSESIFLLQGPPGTGKTQVIAEICAQFAKQGRKVLISSETHKAIDNVFERLPKIPEIRPLRLIPNSTGKETNYSPEKLVDNFYRNIVGKLDKQIRRYENFEELKETFAEKQRSLRLDYQRFLDLKGKCEDTEREIKKSENRRNELGRELDGFRSRRSDLRKDLDRIERAAKALERRDLGSEDLTERMRNVLSESVGSSIGSHPSFSSFDRSKLRELLLTGDDRFESEIKLFRDNPETAGLCLEERRLRRRIEAFRNPKNDEYPDRNDPRYEEFLALRRELSEKTAALKAKDEDVVRGIKEGSFCSFFAEVPGDPEGLEALLGDIGSVKRCIVDSIRLAADELEGERREIQGNIDRVSGEINRIQILAGDLKSDVDSLGGGEEMEEYSKLKDSLSHSIASFFKDFDISREYEKDSFGEAFDIMDEEWNRIEREHQASLGAGESRIPVFKEIRRYLNSEDILPDDRLTFNGDLMDHVNVFGITCTSRDSYTENEMKELRQYGIESVDIKEKGIDVVIVDEVSKSSFLDLLIPILYGKTVILVGDHRQLPPMYDLRHMKEEDFEDLDPKMINKSKHREFTELYEECFFKTLYEKIPSDFKVMLNKQYRCHSDIMEVFNHFYKGALGGGLTVGKKQQDNEKEHGLTMTIGGKRLIEPRHHVVFIDCDGKESREDTSTSKVNEQEAEVVSKLLVALNDSAKFLRSSGKIRLDKAEGIDERPSIGVIATYGDQAGLIKRKRRNLSQLDGFSGKDDERLIVSTVDDFQGDERDIIILSMVRNPDSKRFNSDFITKFERINVALSRARKLLIIVGARQFLSEKGLIDLPDINGDSAFDRKGVPVYEQIIDTIGRRGTILEAKDVLGE